MKGLCAISALVANEVAIIQMKGITVSVAYEIKNITLKTSNILEPNVSLRTI